MLNFRRYRDDSINLILDKSIEAYVNLVNEMEAAGDCKLVEGDIPKTCKEAAT